MKTIKGYEGKKIKLFDYKEINLVIKEGSDKQIIEMFTEIGNLLHWQSDRCKAYKKLNLIHYQKLQDKLKVKMNEIMEERGFKTEGVNRFNSTCMIIDETSKCSDSISLSNEKCYNSSGRIRNKYEILNQFNEITEDEIKTTIESIQELNEDQLRAFLDFLRSESINFEEIREIRVYQDECIQINLFHRDYEILTNKCGEELARDILDDGELWQMCVNEGHTEESKEDWINSVLNQDGWEHEVASYDGCSNYLFGDWVYIRTN